MAVRNAVKHRFLKACRGEAVDTTPVWIMRQAGRYLPEYRALRRKYTMMEALTHPEVAATITLQPLERFDLDAAIIFSDILPPLIGMGLDLEFVPGRGPVLRRSIASTYDIDTLRVPPAAESMAATLAAIRLVQPELKVPLIGFAGAPFTLASYGIEGGASKTYSKTKTLMYNEPAAWDRLMTKLVTVAADLLESQVAAGVNCVQVFDSWVGALSKMDYQLFVQPYSRRLFERLQALSVPVINFSTGTSGYLDAIAAAGGDVIGVDWRVPLDAAARVAGRPVMGNLDPAALFGPWRELRPRIDDVLRRAPEDHIFNLGHGILPETPIDAVSRMVEYVHSVGRQD